MDFTVASVLAIDGVTSGAVYALLAMTIVLVFAVTRVLFIPQGEFVVFGAITFSQLANSTVPVTVILLGVLLVGAVLQEIFISARKKQLSWRVALTIFRLVAWRVLVIVLAYALTPRQPSLLVAAFLSIAVVAAMGPLLYRLVYRSLASSSVLTLLIVSVGVHFVLVGVGLILFGPEGYRAPPFTQASWEIAGVPVSAQVPVIIATALFLITGLFWAFGYTFWGRALRATAVNQLGARIVGLSTQRAGEASFTLAAAIGALSGILIGSTTTLYYDTGFLIGLKGFVAAVIGGLSSFPGALVGAVLIGLVESFGSFWSSAFKEAIVFGAVVPILLFRSTIAGASNGEH